ncbi:recombination factor protein RarA [Campylobacter blaseri]|uniref:Replication-associated recombination protein A n=1 Tax=Campylobacter blaseri TaxID=2042961 RepID=A0A2P8R3B0_9BACT|nr:replication-associated recombination protein A [Campylobacter blaseri]PSM52985.1 AAA family ATPase [Campylobacter blaseri]PSM54452.1 AAA family ATPase [Campylobacter blaseri]QKF85304.1 recombination factor protein RarA [Campylobacter blaseri]
MGLALEFRPKTIEEICGQSHIVGEDKPLYKLIKMGEIPHIMLFGPAGSGKTTLAKVIANELNMDFFELDGSSLKVEDIRKILDRYKGNLIKPLIFIDEVHRLSKTQQEVLLIPMENNGAVVIGASTENPFFVLSSGIRSRSMLFEFKPLTNEDLSKLLNRVQEKLEFNIEEEAKDYLINSSGGDARAMLNLLDYALKINSKIELATLKELRAMPIKDGVSSQDTHYSLTSAMIKSLRGSDINAALYYLAKLIDGGESADFIGRRLVIFASEDIGNANPNALNLATNTLISVSKIGYPEAMLILSQCVVYLASSPKSNSSYKAIKRAIKYVKENRALEIPKYLINTDPEKKNYLYPHDYNGYVEQVYLEKELEFYESSGIGFEKTLQDWLIKIKNR